MELEIKKRIEPILRTPFSLLSRCLSMEQSYQKLFSRVLKTT